MDEKLEIISTNKWKERQKRYNNFSKNIMGMFGANIALYICILIPILLVGFIWTDIGAPIFSVGLISDGAVTVTLFIIGELMMQHVGADGGKLDADYISSRAEFRKMTEEVRALGTMLLRPFCEWQVDIEFEEAINARLKAVRLTKSEYKEIKNKTYRELKEKYGARRAKAIFDINNLTPIELNEAILFYDSVESGARGGIPMSAEQYLHQRSHSLKMIISTIFTCLVTISFAITFTEDITFARVIYTALKLVILFFRMAKGYARGAQAYNTIAPRQYQAKTAILREYNKFVTNRTYLKLGDAYGDLSALIADERSENESIIPDLELLGRADAESEN